MSCRPLALISLLALALSAQAREPYRADVHGDAVARTEASKLQPDNASRVRSTPDADTALADLATRQKRRDVLREALRVQAEEQPAAMRQMSLQEKMELRQQLRQQQEWLK